MRQLVEIDNRLAPVQRVLADALARVESRFDAQLGSDLPAVRELCAHVERYRGKMLRPTLVVLCALAADPRASRRPETTHATAAHVTVAAVCEMVHMATLVHDDVLDEAENRRRGRTVNHLYGNEAAVILGDYLIASAFELCTQLDSVISARLIGAVSMTTCAGELLQLRFRDEYSIDEETYFEIVERKTAALIGASCELGALHSDANPETARLLAEFGRRLGVAFQVQDDLLDLTGDEAIVGKSLGRDLAKGKLTLPMIHHLAGATPAQRGRSLRLAEAAAGASETAQDAALALREALDSTESIAHARETARRLANQARTLLTGLHDSPAREFLDKLATAVVERAY
ncbi:MAG: polyprenyl synthetase family protein [Leptolyngbya sp. PLA2]|nr:polyprenyl synthetase family protein [Leptolyngbya sp. PL-A2]MCQ3940115.1 polyprenyl synthetase family protein [cyanobacterium CYA1]MCZ7632764.1 polyprenyl synthetase family protein [Phycisphaerales bacterium]MDL1904148.1 polyprenyl synthetase family protein [Synechococcales cyanobacterium CNB]GIK19163.1 MAG: polyprenyl synthetase [Planctomycetota bacterium]